jgi:hypothetical protein
MSQATSRWYRKRQLAERYSTTTRTVDRWVENKKFPAPDGRLPNGAPLWADTTIERHERDSVANAKRGEPWRSLGEVAARVVEKVKPRE